MLTYSLDYEGKWWMPVPSEFPDGADASLEAWAARLTASYPVSEPWNTEPLASRLPELLAVQHRELDPSRTVALWYCPFGLPAAGYVEMFVGDHGSDGSDLEAIVAALPSEVAMRPTKVRAAGLGDGVGYTRIAPAATGGGSMAEMGYLFAPGDEATVIVTARSADPAVIGSMSAELWSIVDSIVLA